MAGQLIILCGESQRKYAHEQVTIAPQGHVVIVREPTRSDLQNRKLWPMLQDVSKQVSWHGSMLSPDEWKDMFVSVVKKANPVPGIDGGFVTPGLSSSNLSKAHFSELIEVIYAFGAVRDVVWSEPET